jgi:hypothetical protein
MNPAACTAEVAARRYTCLPSRKIAIIICLVAALGIACGKPLNLDALKRLEAPAASICGSSDTAFAFFLPYWEVSQRQAMNCYRGRLCLGTTALAYATDGLGSKEGMPHISSFAMPLNSIETMQSVRRDIYGHRLLTICLRDGSTLHFLIRDAEHFYSLLDEAVGQ